jgi:hypothetical protein
MTNSIYDRDFYAWSLQQAALLRAGNISEVDVEHLAEEIESMGRSEKRELVNRLVVLLLHLLKWQFQPGLRGNSWRLSIKEQRLRLASHLSDSPSLQARLPDAIAEGYRLALIEAERETGLAEETFPSLFPWTFAELMDADFWPREQAVGPPL